ncbi:unnamed protein product [Parnassius apollo]|uniref:(apollo) hypothetical protein n=1 Tax=Parnassius apollo TaxID=110799 RepID=A0A8S3X4F4_PARAO|nr:unnamed protein product [Parnassius apollo]
MWNPGNKPVPQEFIDVLLDEEELDIDEDHGELVEEYDAEEILNIPVDTKRASGSPQCPTVEMSGEVHVLDVPAPEPAPEVPGEVHVLDVPASFQRCLEKCMYLMCLLQRCLEKCMYLMCLLQSLLQAPYPASGWK